MIAKAAALEEPRFWAAYLCSSFGQIGEPFDPPTVCAALGVAEEEARAWWHDFTGWRAGIFDEGDGFLENPVGVAVPFSSRFMLEVETHPGDTLYYLRSLDGRDRLRIGEVGPHWRLPMLRWSEAARLPAHALILAMPGVWVAPDQDDGRAVAEQAFSVLPLADKSSAMTLADQWIQAVGEGAVEYPWYKDSALGWVSSAHWSMRSREAAEAGFDVRTINDVLAAAGVE